MLTADLNRWQCICVAPCVANKLEAHIGLERYQTSCPIPSIIGSCRYQYQYWCIVKHCVDFSTNIYSIGLLILWLLKYRLLAIAALLILEISPSTQNWRMSANTPIPVSFYDWCQRVPVTVICALHSLVNCWFHEQQQNTATAVSPFKVLEFGTVW